MVVYFLLYKKVMFLSVFLIFVVMVSYDYVLIDIVLCIFMFLVMFFNLGNRGNVFSIKCGGLIGKNDKNDSKD